MTKPDPHCRVRVKSVRLEGGAELRVLRRDVDMTPDGITANFRRATGILEEMVPDMVGYFIVAWNNKGESSEGLANGFGSPVLDLLLPEFVAQRCLRRQRED